MLRDCRIRDALFGVYLREANGAVVERCRIRGIPGKDPGEKGSGIHVWNTEGFRFAGNEIVDVRDGLYIQPPRTASIRGNVARDLRYGLHYMFSDDNLFEDNTFENGAAGTAIMYSERIVFRRNRFLQQPRLRLGRPAVQDLRRRARRGQPDRRQRARHLPRGLAPHHVFRGNVVAGSDMAIVLYDSAADTGSRATRSSATCRRSTLVGARAPTPSSTGNYWSDNDEPDLDGDGRSDRPYRLTSVFDHFRGNLTAADLLSRQASRPRRSAPPSGRSRCCGRSPVEDRVAARAAARRCPDVPTADAARDAAAQPLGLAASLARSALGRRVLVLGGGAPRGGRR